MTDYVICGRAYYDSHDRDLLTDEIEQLAEIILTMVLQDGETSVEE